MTPFHVKPVPEGRLWPAWLTPALGLLENYGALLCTQGVAQGLLGPREVDRIWDRHLLNCTLAADPDAGLVPLGSRVADVGSGAGLPGLVWAIVRPDLTLTLVEPLLRRWTFLVSAVEELGLGARVSIVRERAEDLAGSPQWRPVDIVTARAVAPLNRLVGWTIPLATSTGCLIALKGQSAGAEVADATAACAALGVVSCEVEVLQGPYTPESTTVVIARRGAAE